jgi:acyl-coenzyme A thioesterase PaaI-like protein
MQYDPPVAQSNLVLSAAELVLPHGSTLDPALVFAVATRTNAAQAALGTQLLGVEPAGATIRTPWRDDLGTGASPNRWSNVIVATLIDHACSLAALVALDDVARWAGSLDLRVDYRRPLDASAFLTARAVCDERIGAVIRVRASGITDDRDDDPVAIGFCSIAVVEPAAEASRP